MTENEQRAAKYCERCITYLNLYLEEFYSESDITHLTEAEELDMIPSFTGEIMTTVNDEKKHHLSMLFRARQEVSDLIKMSGISGKTRRIMILRYCRGWKWKRIAGAVRITKTHALRLRLEALNNMGAIFDRFLKVVPENPYEKNPP